MLGMAGPRTGRVMCAAAAAAATLFVVGVIRSGAPVPAAVTVPALFAALVAIARLGLWAALWRDPRPADVDAATRESAEAMLATTEVAVVCDGDSMVAARIAAIAAIAAVGDADRVLLVGADPRLEGLASSLGVRHVAAGIGVRAGIDAAIGATAGTHLVLGSASSALLPGALRPALERFDDGVAWVQAGQHAPGDRTLLDHVRHSHWWPALDAQDAMPWLGLDSVVSVEAFRSIEGSTGCASSTVAAQRQGHHGRWSPSMLAVEQSDGRRDPRAEVSARVERLRGTIGRSSPVLDRELTTAQRLAHASALADDLVGVAALAVVVSLVAGLATGSSPVPLDGALAPAGLAVLLGWAARLLLTRGLVRPFALARAAVDDLPVALRSLAAAVLPARLARAPRTARARPSGWRSHLLAIVLVTIVDVAALRHAWIVLRRDDPPNRVDVALFGAVAIVLAMLLSSARVLRRRRTLRGARRMPAEVAARIGPWQGRVLDLSASGLRAEFGAPAELLTEVPVRLQARGVRPVDVQAQVVRVDERANTWVLGLRLTGGAASGALDEYLALWLTQMAGAAEERPRRVDDPVLGRRRVHAAGAPALRVLTAAAMLLVGVAVLPLGGPAGAASDGAVAQDGQPGDGHVDDEHVGADDHESDDDGATGDDVLAATTSSVDVGATSETLPVVARETPSDDTSTTEATASGDDGDTGDAGDEGDSGEDGEPGPPTARPTAGAGGLTATASVDDDDRIVEGGQTLTHTVELTNDAEAPIDLADVVVGPATGTVDPASLAGDCPGAEVGAVDAVPGAATAGSSVRWRLFEAAPLEPGDTCSVTWRVTLPAATSLDDGERIGTEIDVANLLVDGNETAGPTLTDEVLVHRPTLRLSLTAGDGTALDQMTIGVPFTWVLEVENISPAPATAHGIDLVQTLPKHWTYTSTVSVQPMACDVAPVVLVDDVSATQVITWSDTCDLAMGERMEIVFTATAGDDAATDPGVADEAGNRIAHVSDVTLTAEDLAGTTLGSASDRAGAIPRTVDLTVRLSDAGVDDATAQLGPAVMVGGPGRYRVDVGNDGPDATSRPVAVAIDLPLGLTVTSAAGAGWSCALGAPTTCTHDGPIAADDVTEPIAVTVAVGVEALAAVGVDGDPDGDPDVAVVTARATVSGGGPEADPTDDIDDETTTVRLPGDGSGPPSADLTVTAVTGKRALSAGEAFTYEVLVTNQGPTADPGPVTVGATVPAGLTTSEVTGEGWACDVRDPGEDDGGTWSCETTGPVAVGAQLPPIRVGGTYTGAASENLAPSAELELVQAVSVDGSTVAGSDDATGEVSWSAVPEASLGLVVRQAYLEEEVDAAAAAETADDGWRVGTSGVVKLIVVNDGPSGEYGPIDVVVPTPDGARIVDAGGDGWACRRESGDAGEGQGDATGGSADDERWACRLARAGVGYGEPLVAVGASAPPLGVSVVFVADGTAEFVATVSGATDPVVHRGSASFEVGRRANASILLSAVDEVRAGETTWLSIDVANSGPSDLVGPTRVQLALPEGWTADAVDDGSWACSTGGAATSIVCVREAPVATQEATSFGVRVAVPADAESGEVAVAVVLAQDPDEQEPSDDSDDREIYVWGAGDTEGPTTTTTTTVDQAHAVAHEAAPVAVGDLAGYGGAAGAFAFAVLLLSGRRRPGW